MKRVMVLAVLLVAGCGHSEKHSVSALLEADLAHGNLTMTCRASSSGTCHALIVTGEKSQRFSAAANGQAQLSVIDADPQYCVAPDPPESGCKLVPLKDGQQIVRFESSRSE